MGKQTMGQARAYPGRAGESDEGNLLTGILGTAISIIRRNHRRIAVAGNPLNIQRGEPFTAKVCHARGA